MGTMARPDRRVGGRVIKRGDIVRIRGRHGTYKVDHFDNECVHVYGGPQGREMWRSFYVDAIGARPRKIEVR